MLSKCYPRFLFMLGYKSMVLKQRGEPLTLRITPFLFDIYSDLSPLQVIMKPAQVGLTLLQMIKLFLGGVGL